MERGPSWRRTLWSLACVVARLNPHLGEGDWSGIRRALEGVFDTVPNVEEIGRCRESLTTIRRSMNAVLLRATEPKPNYMGGIEPVRVAVLLADETTLEPLLGLVRARSVFRQKILLQPRGEYAVARRLACDTVLRLGNSLHHGALAQVIVGALRGSDDDAKIRDVFIRCGATLLETLRANQDSSTLALLETLLPSTSRETAK